MGRPPHEPTDQTRRTVEGMSAYGIPQEEISKVIGIDRNTLMKYYREELDTAKARANAKVAESLYKKALANDSGSVTAAIFWLKTRAGWKETIVNEHGGIDGEDIKVTTRIERHIIKPNGNAQD